MFKFLCIGVLLLTFSCGGCGDDATEEMPRVREDCSSDQDLDGDGLAGCDDPDCRLADICAFEPPDPGSIQTLVVTTGTTSFYERTKFIWNADTPIQRGVGPDVIDPATVAAVSGRVKTPDGEILAGVAVTLFGDEAFGTTYSRSDGKFDFVFNGGGDVVIRFEKRGYTSVFRTVNAQWEENAAIEDVVLTPLSDRKTTVDIGSSKFVLGGEATDESGTRQTNVYFPSDITAELVFADDTTEPVEQINVSTTEVTVGETGRQAMAGQLPRATLYTFAADFTVDEVIEAGAEHVRFSAPVFLYVDNFLGVPNGSSLPNGFFDYVDPSWKGTPDGIAFTITAIEDGRAVLDLGGAGTPGSIGMSDDERRAIAANYSVGDSLWRVPAFQFSTIDINFPPELSPDNVPAPPDIDPTFQDSTCRNRTEPGSIIDCDSQTLGEVIPLNGTPFNLVYNSRRVEGRLPTVTIVVRDETVLPESLFRVGVELEIAGRRYEAVFDVEDGVPFIHEFTWDRRDQFGRKIQGGVPATTRVTYHYSIAYWLSKQIMVSALSADFALEPDDPSDFATYPKPDGAEVMTSRGETYITRESNLWVGGWDVSEEKLGGWTLDTHHRYDPDMAALEFGTGGLLTSSEAPRTLSRIAGVDSSFTPNFGCELSYCGSQGGDPFEYYGADIHLVEYGRSGEVYFVPNFGPGNPVFRINTDGTVDHFAGKIGQRHQLETSSVPGQPAKEVAFRYVVDLRVAFNGDLYVADDHAIWKISDGLATPVVGGGNGWSLHEIEGQDATELYLGGGGTFVLFDVARDGSIVFAERAVGDARIFKRMPNGKVIRIAGTDQACESPPCSARSAQELSIGNLSQLAVLSDDSIVFVETGPLFGVSESHVRKISGTDGSVETLWSGGVQTLEIGPNDEILVVTHPLPVIPGPDDTCIEPLIFELGDEPKPIFGSATCDGRFQVIHDIETESTTEPLSAGIRNLGVSPSGDIAFVHRNYVYRLRQRGLPARNETGYDIPSRSSDSIFSFTPDGRHTATTDTLTGVQTGSFTYENGYLTSVSDQFGLESTLRRDPDDHVTEIVGPYGATWSLDQDPNGFLASLRSPENETWSFTYDDGGLMKSMEDPNGRQWTFDYDDVGRLTADGGPEGTKTIEREFIGPVQSVDFTSGEGRTTTYSKDLTGTREQELTGFVRSSRSTIANGYHRTVAADQTETFSRLEPHPLLGSIASYNAFVGTYTPGGVSIELETTKTAARNELNIVNGFESSFERTEAGDVTLETTWDGATRTLTSITGEGRESTVEFDENARVKSATQPGVVAAEYRYDGEGRLVQTTQGSRTVDLSYDANGFLTTIDAGDAVLELQNDKMGRPTTSSLGGEQVRLTWDGVSDLAALTNGIDQTYDIERNSAGQITRLTGPDSEFRYDYNGDYLPERVLYPDNREATFGYDEDLRLTSLTAPGDSRTFSYDLGTADRPGSGYLTEATRQNGANLAFEYDGFLKTSETWSGEVTSAINWNYGDNFLLRELVVNGDAIAYEYDLDGSLTKVGDLQIDYRANTFAPETVSLNGIERDITYDPFGYPTSVQTSGRGFNAQFEYTYDGLGRISSVRETFGANTTTKSYSYNAQGRVTEVDVDGVITEQYTYDANGNRLSTLGVATTDIEFDEEDQLIRHGAASLGYRAGQLQTLSSGPVSVQFGYGMFGELREVVLPSGRITYGHDAMNRRVAKYIDGSFVAGWIYQDALNPVAEIDTSGNTVSRFVYGTKPHVPDFMIRGGVTYAIVTDHLGSVRWVVDTTDGSVVQAITYDTYGVIESNTNPGLQPFGYAGGLYDPDTQLVRFGARDYLPGIGRWLARDPAGFAGGSANLYQYVNGDPVNLIDVTGHVPQLAAAALSFGIIGAGVGAGVNVLREHVAGGNNYGEAAKIGLAGGFVGGVTTFGLSLTGIGVVGVGLGTGVGAGFTTFGNLRHGLVSSNDPARTILTNAAVAGVVACGAAYFGPAILNQPTLALGSELNPLVVGIGKVIGGSGQLLFNFFANFDVHVLGRRVE